MMDLHNVTHIQIGHRQLEVMGHTEGKLIVRMPDVDTTSWPPGTIFPSLRLNARRIAYVPAAGAVLIRGTGAGHAR